MFKADLGKRAIKHTQQYAITLTLHPKVRKMNAEEQYEEYAHQCVSELKRLFSNCKLTLICEMTKTFDIHFHGVISFDMATLRSNQNVPKMFRDSFRNHKYIGFVLLKVIDNQSVWNEYIMKSLKDFEKDTGKFPLLINEFIISPAEQETAQAHF